MLPRANCSWTNVNPYESESFTELKVAVSADWWMYGYVDYAF